ncbi:Nematode resistance protein like [Actinidia chinensis var. chinensis]|uniref:Nematode resistance protein like n=1 Tax=Actinidia chinensis var. chinensis TaxID=1590841 RepID=A0A2R6PM86_ACTCC|nr:Nematode resistance protein like [Actinidia chinensis var. chinensis]
MVDLECKAKMITSNSPIKSPKLSTKLKISVPTEIRVGDLSPPSESAYLAYENYLRLPELKKLWSCREFPSWENESLLRPALQALEITFRFVSTVFSDPRPYANQREWRRRIESLATAQIQVVALICEDDETRGNAPIVDLNSSEGVLARGDSLVEVWKLSKETTVVSRASEASLLPRLATWQKSEEVAQKILYSIECEMRRCPYTLGLGEPNLAGKPSLDYDLLCKPSDLQGLKKSPSDLMNLKNHENQTLYTTQQILESWIHVSQQLLKRIVERIDSKDFEKASTDCWLLERTWKLLSEIEDLHLLMDPNDFLRLKNQLAMKSSSESEAFCFRSRGLTEITKLSKDLRHKVPFILGVEVDPKGGPRIQEAAMRLYRKRRESEKIHLLQALQAIESALKRFYYAYKQLIVTVMGSLEAKGNQAFVSVDSRDSLAQIFLEPTYFPSLDAAKTFLGHEWSHERGQYSPERRKHGHK